MLGLPKSGKTVGYSGSESWRHIDRLLESNGRHIKIITPFISDYYVDRILKIARKKKVYLLLSGAGKAEEAAVKRLLKRNRSLNLGMIAYLALIVAGLAYLKFYVYAAGVGAIALFALYYGMVLKPAGTKLFVKIATDRFIHEKLYLSDDTAIVGSANLTYAGTHRNVEHIEVINDPARVDELSLHFDGLWGRY